MCDHRRALLDTVCQFGALLFFFLPGMWGAGRGGIAEAMFIERWDFQGAGTLNRKAWPKYGYREGKQNWRMTSERRENLELGGSRAGPAEP